MNKIKAYWTEQYKDYKLTLGLNNDNEVSLMTLDTGAGSTIIGSNILLKCGVNSMENNVDIMNFLNIMQVTPRIFLSATNTRMAAYPCYLENVLLSGVLFTKFYFYLFLGKENLNICLLGNDFIRFCSMSKSINSDIALTDFSFDVYEENFLKDCGSDVVLSVNRIYDELERIESTKDLASAFRYIISHPTR